MTQVSVDKEFMEELMDLKLQFLNEEIEKILESWHYQSPSKLLIDAKEGILEEAEMDSITLTHLIDQREEIFQLKNKWNTSE